MTADAALDRMLVAGTDHVGRRRHQPTAAATVLIVAGVALTPLALRSPDRVPIGVLVGIVALIALDAMLARRRIGTPIVRVHAPAVVSSEAAIELSVEVAEPSGEVLDVGPTGIARAESVSVPGSVTVWMAPTGRGVFEVWSLRVGARGPLGLGSCSRRIMHRPTRPTAVLPPPAPHPPLVLDDLRESSSGEPVEVVGLRDGRAGAPLRDVHWPTVARTGRLVVRERRPAEQLCVPVVVSLERWADHPNASWPGADPVALARTAGAAILAQGGRLELHGSCRATLPPGTTLHADRGRLDARTIGVAPVVREITDLGAWSLALALLSHRGSFDLPAPPFLLVRSDGITWERER